MEDYRVQLEQSTIRAAELQKDRGGATINYETHQETRYLWSKSKINNSSSSIPTYTIIDAAATKENRVQWLRETRDYSFLSSSATAPIRDPDLITKKPIKLIFKFRGKKIFQILTTTKCMPAANEGSNKKLKEGKKKEFIKQEEMKNKSKDTAVKPAVSNKQEEEMMKKKEFGKGEKGGRVVGGKRGREERELFMQIFGCYPSDDEDDEDLFKSKKAQKNLGRR